MLPSYRCYLSEPVHFLVEYESYSTPCQSTWHVQRLENDSPKLVEDGSIVNTDCSSILIIESITTDLQGTYTFHVENIHGHATTQTKLIISNKNDDRNENGRSMFFTNSGSLKFAFRIS